MFNNFTFAKDNVKKRRTYIEQESVVEEDDEDDLNFRKRQETSNEQQYAFDIEMQRVNSEKETAVYKVEKI